MNADDARAHIFGALRRALRPLCRIMIRVGIRDEEFSALARAAFVECAIRDIEHRSAPSRARIAALTGLTLQDVDLCIDGASAVPLVDPTLRAILVEVLQKWHTIPEYCGPYGIPLELEFSAPPDRCFSSLVQLVNSTANPNSVLAELLRSGAVLRAGDKRFRPISRAFMIPDPTSPKLIERFGMTLSRLAHTLEYNTNPKNIEKRLERRVSADQGMSVDLVPAFEAYARAKTAEYLLEVDNWLATHGSKDDEDVASSHRVETGVNIFFYVDRRASESETSLRVLVDSAKPPSAPGG